MLSECGQDLVPTQYLGSWVYRESCWSARRSSFSRTAIPWPWWLPPRDTFCTSQETPRSGKQPADRAKAHSEQRVSTRLRVHLYDRFLNQIEQ